MLIKIFKYILLGERFLLHPIIFCERLLDIFNTFLLFFEGWNGVLICDQEINPQKSPSFTELFNQVDVL